MCRTPLCPSHDENELVVSVLQNRQVATSHQVRPAATLTCKSKPCYMLRNLPRNRGGCVSSEGGMLIARPSLKPPSGSGTAMRNRPSGQRHDVFMKLTEITVVIRPMWDTPILSWGENSDGLCRALEFRVHFFVFGLGSLHLPISILSAQAGVI